MRFLKPQEMLQFGQWEPAEKEGGQAATSFASYAEEPVFAEAENTTGFTLLQGSGGEDAIQFFKEEKVDRQKPIYFLLLLGYYLGLIAGSFMPFAGVGTTFVPYFFEGFLQAVTGKTMLAALPTFLSIAFIPLTLQFFLAFSLFAGPILAVLPYLYGMCTGVMAAYIYGIMGIQGFYVNLVLFLPFACVVAAMQIFFTGKVFHHSLAMLRFYRQSMKGEEVVAPVPTFIIKYYAICMALAVLLAVLQILLLQKTGLTIL